jgi:two-component system KDP operon response regulator KdpE
MSATILIIEDDPGVQEALKELLRSEGFTANSARTGEIALEMLARENYDLVLLDLHLPGNLDGRDLMGEISQLYPGTRVIIITGHGSLETAIAAIRSGARDYILKPYRIDDFLLSIRRVLSEKETKVRKEILIEQLASSLDQLKDVEGIRGEELPARRVASLPGNLMADLERREIWRGDQRVHLTPTESKLLSIFLENRGRVLGHRELVFLVQGIQVSEGEAPEILRPMVSRLRKKLAAFPGLDAWISNVRGTGYLFEPS